METQCSFFLFVCFFVLEIEKLILKWYKNVKNFNTQNSYKISSPLLGWYPKNPETPIQKNLCTPMFIAAQFTIAKCWNQPKCPSVSEWVKKLWYIYKMEYYAAERKKELLPFATAWMELESTILSVISPGSERQIPYDFTFNQHLINKMNKQAKYNQRHWNWEQADSDQTGEGRGLQGNRVKGL